MSGGPSTLLDVMCRKRGCRSICAPVRGWTSPGVEQCLEVMGKLWGALSIGVRWAGLPTVSRGWVAEEPEGSQGDQLEVVRAAGWYGQRREAET